MLWPLWACAHQLPLGLGVVQLRGTQAVVEISVPESVITGVASSTPLDSRDLIRHKGLIDMRLTHGFVLEAIKAGSNPEPGVWKDLQWTHTPATAQSETVFHVTGSVEFAHPPQALNIRYALWPNGDGANTLRLTVSRMNPQAPPDIDVALISKGHPEAKVLVPWNEMLAGVVVQGVDHIIGGADHLLFLVTLLASHVLLRRWLVLLTAFTLAHGITFGLASLGWIHVPVEWVEPAIAATIVLVALLQLSGRTVQLWVESMLVFSLGLIHGLGFASAMQIDGGFEAPLARFPVMSILGFNVGVEIGQIAVALFALMVLTATRRFAGIKVQGQLIRFNLLFAVVLGSYWFVERVWN